MNDTCHVKIDGKWVKKEDADILLGQEASDDLSKKSGMFFCMGADPNSTDDRPSHTF